jgi:exosome complex component RRP4
MITLPGEKIAGAVGAGGGSGSLRGHGIFEGAAAATRDHIKEDIAHAFHYQAAKRRRCTETDDAGSGPEDLHFSLGASLPSSGRVLLACATGVVERVNKLVSVKRVTGIKRYSAEVGDIVVGRVTEVGSKRWKLDIQGHRSAVLHLSGVNLAGGAQRVRTYQDSLNMRTVFTEGDFVSAEVQTVTADGIVNLHTRSLTYGKMENGQVQVVPAGLVQRIGKHALALEECGVDILLGNNGVIWITRPGGLRVSLGGSTAEEELAEVIERERRRHVETPITAAERRRISEVRSAIVALAAASAAISPVSISREVSKAPKRS